MVEKKKQKPKPPRVEELTHIMIFHKGILYAAKVHAQIRMHQGISESKVTWAGRSTPTWVQKKQIRRRMTEDDKEKVVSGEHIEDYDEHNNVCEQCGDGGGAFLLSFI